MSDTTDYKLSYSYQAMLGRLRTGFTGSCVVRGEANTQLVADWLRGRGIVGISVETYNPPSMAETMKGLRETLAEFRPVTLEPVEDLRWAKP